MELIVGICRYTLPVLAFIILVKCFMTLLIGHPVNENYAYIEDKKTGERIALNMWETSIGKSKTCDIMLGHDVISRFHAVICRRVDGWYVFDTISKNGTYVKKTASEKPEKVPEEGMLIEDGNIICFSNREYRFTITNDPIIRVGKRKKVKGNVSQTAARNTAAGETIYAPGAGSSQQTASRQAALISKKKGTIYLLIENAVTIGSSKSNDIRLQNPTVSRLHAILTKNNGWWYITDKNSTNGTTVNGVRIKGTQMLRKNDVIGVSDEFFTFTNDYR